MSGFAAVVCVVVVIVFAVAEFTQGAWVVVVVMPLLVLSLTRTNRQYRVEDVVLEEGLAVEACEAKILRRHVVVILIDRIDLATARAIQYARTLMPDDLRAVHFNIDNQRAERLIERWQQVGLTRLPLDVIDCPDRRLGRAALELAAELADGETEVSILLPRRSYGRAWRRILHDQTADRIVDIVSQLSHVNATIVPFAVAPGIEDRRPFTVPLRRQPARTPTTPLPEARAHRVLGHARRHPHRRSCSGAPTPGWRDGSRPCACSRGGTSPPSSACSPTAAARPSPSSSSGAGPSPASAAGRRWRPTPWWASTRGSWP